MRLATPAREVVSRQEMSAMIFVEMDYSIALAINVMMATPKMEMVVPPFADSNWVLSAIDSLH